MGTSMLLAAPTAVSTTTVWRGEWRGQEAWDPGVPLLTCPMLLVSRVLKYLFIYFCLCWQAFSSCCEPGLLFVVVHRLLITVASLVVKLKL